MATDAVSIHAPAWGATRAQCSACACVRRFNPRARVGRDSERRLCSRATLVSIHAPAWGATGVRCCEWRICSRFNPRARVGRDIEAATFEASYTTFQSTRPRGARLDIQLRCLESTSSFNPRARVGRDIRSMRARRRHHSFQSTRPRGARPGAARKIYTAIVFQSTRPRGARPHDSKLRTDKNLLHNSR